MKKLVLGALLVAGSSVASSVGCGGGGTSTAETSVTVAWTFTHLADNSARSCPQDFPTAAIYSQAIDSTSHHLVGQQFIDKFDCNGNGGTGTISLPDGAYLVWVQIETDSGSNVYAISQESFVDTADGDQQLSVDILDDGGYFTLTWDLVTSNSGALLSCATAGVTSNGSVEVISTGSVSSTDDKFTCTDHFGTTGGLLAGDYTIAIDAEQNGTALGSPVTTTDSIQAPNVLTDLGNIEIPID